jgi:hypothetical protein
MSRPPPSERGSGRRDRQATPIAGPSVAALREPSRGWCSYNPVPVASYTSRRYGHVFTAGIRAWITSRVRVVSRARLVGGQLPKKGRRPPGISNVKPASIGRMHAFPNKQSMLYPPLMPVAAAPRGAQSRTPPDESWDHSLPHAPPLGALPYVDSSEGSEIKWLRACAEGALYARRRRKIFGTTTHNTRFSYIFRFQTRPPRPSEIVRN